MGHWQRNWLGHIMRGDSLLRTIIEGRMEWEKKRPRIMLLDWMMKDDYSKLKKRAGHHGDIGRMNQKEEEATLIYYYSYDNPGEGMDG